MKGRIAVLAWGSGGKGGIGGGDKERGTVESIKDRAICMEGGAIEVEFSSMVDVDSVDDFIGFLLDLPDSTTDGVTSSVGGDGDAETLTQEASGLRIPEGMDAIKSGIDRGRRHKRKILLIGAAKHGVLETHATHVHGGEGCIDSAFEAEMGVGIGVSTEVGEVRMGEEEDIDLTGVGGQEVEVFWEETVIPTAVEKKKGIVQAQKVAQRPI